LNVLEILFNWLFELSREAELDLEINDSDWNAMVVRYLLFLESHWTFF
jgi:hypothetical protein